jgi:addiction module HigA family antidote
VHPGEILREEFMVPLALSANALALHLRVPATRISEIVNERRSISPETALRLALYFNTTPDFWMNLQTQFDLDAVDRDRSAEIQRQIHPRRAPALPRAMARRS